jgi:hypothetical protein
MPIVRGELFVVFCPIVLAVLDHPVAVEFPCWTMFKRVFLQCLLVLLYFFVHRLLTVLVPCVYFAEVGVQFDFSNLSLRGRTILTSVKVVVQASP